MASAQQKPKKERGTRNSARRNGKAFKKPTTKGKPSYNSCLGVSLLKFPLNNKGLVSYADIEELYQKFASRRNWTTAQAFDKALNWYTRYLEHIQAKRRRLSETSV
jgi:hypothetical protein